MRSQSKPQPIRFIVATMFVMFRSVISRGCPPSRIAAFSAGRPNESKPMGCRTVIPFRRRKRERMSPIV